MDVKSLPSFFARRLGVVLSLCIVTPLSFWIWRGYHGPARIWVNFYLSGAFYVLFWCLVVFFFAPKKKYALKIALGVLAATCLLEFLQLWHPAFLQNIRATFLGQAILGTCFVWAQFPYYFAGSLVSFFLLKLLAAEE
jgi:hypothetical protein